MSTVSPSTLVSSEDSAKESNTTTYSVEGIISAEHIITTRDRAALVFHEYVRNRAWTTDGLACLAIFAGLLIPLVTVTDFRGLIVRGDILLDGATCKAIVVLLCVGSGLLGLYCFIRRFINHKKLTCQYFLEQLKQNNVNVD